MSPRGSTQLSREHENITCELDATSDEDPWALNLSPSQHAISQIESMLQSVVEDLLVCKPLTITLHRRPTRARARALGSGPNSPLDFHENPPLQNNITFPGQSPEEAWKFTVVTSLLDLVHEALVSGNLVSKRDIFYKDPALFGTQDLVDRLVDDIAYTFRVPRSRLNVTAAAKGLVAGALIIHREGNPLPTSVDCSADPEGTLITPVQVTDTYDIQHAEFVLIVEKEAVFRALASIPDVWHIILRKGILITGKGYADISTRALLSRLAGLPSCNSLRIPVYALVDFDPDGIAILSTYKHGSTALAHEGDHIVTPSIQWLGLRSGNLQPGQCLQRLSVRDRRKSLAMLAWPRFAQESSEGGPDAQEERRELQIMLMLNVKAEIEMLYARPGGLSRWFHECFTS